MSRERENIRDEKIQQVVDKSVEYLDDILETLLTEAKGIHFAVAPHTDARSKPKPHEGDFVAKVNPVEKVCKKCGQAVLKDPVSVWEVYKSRPNPTALKFLYEQIAGRAKQREEEKVDPVITIVFGDIDSEPDIEVVEEVTEVKEEQRMNEVKELNGSSGRTPKPKSVAEKIKLGLPL